MSTRLEVVVVPFRCRDLLRACLQSLRKHPCQGGMIVHVVDSASAHGTVEMVRREFPEVRLDELSDNTGFPRANNVALRKTRAPYGVFSPERGLPRRGTLRERGCF